MAALYILKLAYAHALLVVLHNVGGRARLSFAHMFDMSDGGQLVQAVLQACPVATCGNSNSQL